MRISWFGPMIAVLCISAAADAAVLRVPADHATIQAGVLAASAGDTVLVAPGEYSELIQMKNGVVLRAMSGPDATLLNSPQIGTNPADERVIECPRGVDRSTIIEGFRMRGGMIKGAGIYCKAASPTIRGNVIQEFGWGVDLRDSSNALIEDNTIEDCIGFGIFVFASSPIIRRNTIARNDPRGISIGGRKSHPVIGGRKEDANRLMGSRFAILNESRNDIDATWNDWGWAATTEMDRYPYPTDVSVIQDGNDRGKTHRGRGKVDYRNWLLPTKADAAAAAKPAGTQPSTRTPADSTQVAALDSIAPVAPDSVGAPATMAAASPAPEKSTKSSWLVIAALAIALALLGWRKLSSRRGVSAGP